MQMKCSKKISSLLLCMVLIVAMALFTTGCNGNNSPSAKGTEETAQTEETGLAEEDVQTDDTEQAEEDIQTDDTEQIEENVQSDENAQPDESVQAEGTVLGEGNTKFILTVVDKEGAETQFEIHTDKETVGEALEELELIDGEEGEYGLYVKTVNGITADYDKDGVYWAFYINGEYAQTGIDVTAITEGDNYTLKVE